MVTVEPGVITGNLHRAVEAEGLFYPPDPASLDSRSIGGNIAEGAGRESDAEFARFLDTAWLDLRVHRRIDYRSASRRL
jgi:hypothetical protein